MRDDSVCSSDSQKQPSSDGEMCAKKLREMIEVWEHAGLPYDEVAEWIDKYHLAARVAERFRREQPQLAAAMAKAKSLDSEADLHRYLEGWLRKWDLDETEAYRQLIILGQGFLTVPSDPSGFGLWFRVIHRERWAAIVERTGLGDDGLVDFIHRLMVDDGLSPLELYEGMIDMSQHVGSDGMAGPGHRQRERSKVPARGAGQALSENVG